MRIIFNVLVALALFIGIQACRGFFDSFQSILSMNIWLSMSAKDIWIFLGCLLISGSI